MIRRVRAGKMLGASIAAVTLTAACGGVGAQLTSSATPNRSSEPQAPAMAGMDMSHGMATVHVQGEEVPHNDAASGGSRAEADVTMVRHGDVVTITVDGKRSAPGLVHVQHIHGPGMHQCPTIAADVNHDGLISTTEGVPDYGPVVVSLTTTGDTSPSSGLAVDRFPVADANGNYHYQRDFTVGVDIPASVADHLTDFHVVSHGIDTNHNGSYDFSKGPSDLNPSLPQEATVPASCGLIQR
jgi:hypothetical protein